MRFVLSLPDEFLAKRGLDRSTLELLAEQEELFLANSRRFENSDAPLPQGISRSEMEAIVQQELAEFGAAAYPPSSFFGTSGSLFPRRQQAAHHLVAVASAGTASQSRDGTDWTLIRGRVVNATNTYHSYSREAGGGQYPGRYVFERERVYQRQPDGTYRWVAFAQCSRATLAGSATKNLEQIVRDVGGNPATFKSRSDMADFVLARERPLGVVRKEDEAEIFCGSFPVNLGPPASECYWGVGQWENGVLHIESALQVQVEDWRVTPYVG
ncbi:hypothetical protein ACJQWK_10518 [Exserohilum turcicum]|uniref:Uncharacterized protein n=1 Tax=Exserohilum turcicum (strain 28A) TaxID=671987 RepID=R0I7G0_EXST2|nr:uncharacterized protein SETTUDRAFT_23890 [Exserohilum turcica Et28A]EOA81500.1 hypothetical protein SETTUDRAFT_23890 [Exserohilum turcica Et28A]